MPNTVMTTMPHPPSESLGSTQSEGIR
jgi:hypothetical protein